MLDRRHWRLDAAATALLCTGLVVALAVFSYDPADVPGRVYPPPGRPANLLGQPGARLADALVQTLGLAVHVLLASWFVLVVMLFLRRGWLTWSLRLLGWVLLVPCACVLAQRWALPGPRGPLVGPGG